MYHFDFQSASSHWHAFYASSIAFNVILMKKSPTVTFTDCIHPGWSEGGQIISKIVNGILNFQFWKAHNPNIYTYLPLMYFQNQNTEIHVKTCNVYMRTGTHEHRSWPWIQCIINTSLLALFSMTLILIASFLSLFLSLYLYVLSRSAQSLWLHACLLRST